MLLYLILFCALASIAKPQYAQSYYSSYGPQRYYNPYNYAQPSSAYRSYYQPGNYYGSYGQNSYNYYNSQPSSSYSSSSYSSPYYSGYNYNSYPSYPSYSSSSSSSNDFWRTSQIMPIYPKRGVNLGGMWLLCDGCTRG